MHGPATWLRTLPCCSTWCKLLTGLLACRASKPKHGRDDSVPVLGEMTVGDDDDEGDFDQSKK